MKWLDRWKSGDRFLGKRYFSKKDFPQLFESPSENEEGFRFDEERKEVYWFSVWAEVALEYGYPGVWPGNEKPAWTFSLKVGSHIYGHDNDERSSVKDGSGTPHFEGYSLRSESLDEAFYNLNRAIGTYVQKYYLKRKAYDAEMKKRRKEYRLAEKKKRKEKPKRRADLDQGGHV